MQRWITLLLCVSLLAPGCAATTGGGGSRTPPVPPRADPSLMAPYVRQLPVGSRIKVALVDGSKVRGTLMKADDTSIVVQPRTRIPEAPLEIPLERILEVELDTNGGSIARTVGIGFAAGAGGALAVILILAAIFAGD